MEPPLDVRLPVSLTAGLVSSPTAFISTSAAPHSPMQPPPVTEDAFNSDAPPLPSSATRPRVPSATSSAAQLLRMQSASRIAAALSAPPAAPPLRPRAGTGSGLAPSAAAMSGFPLRRFGGEEFDNALTPLASTLAGHVQARAGSLWRPAVGSAGAPCRRALDLLAAPELLLAALWGCVTGILLSHYPTVSFWENAAWKWTSFAAALCAAAAPLRAIEAAMFAGVERLEEAIKLLERDYALLHGGARKGGKRGSGRLFVNLALRCVDVPRFLLPMKGHLAHIALVVMALLLKNLAFELVFSNEFFFTRTCGFLFAIEVGVIVKGMALEVVSRMLALRKHGEAVQQCIYTEEVLCVSLLFRCALLP